MAELRMSRDVGGVRSRAGGRGRGIASSLLPFFRRLLASPEAGAGMHACNLHVHSDR